MFLTVLVTLTVIMALEGLTLYLLTLPQIKDRVSDYLRYWLGVDDVMFNLRSRLHDELSALRDDVLDVQSVGFNNKRQTDLVKENMAQLAMDLAEHIPDDLSRIRDEIAQLNSTLNASQKTIDELMRIVRLMEESYGKSFDGIVPLRKTILSLEKTINQYLTKAKKKA